MPLMPIGATPINALDIYTEPPHVDVQTLRNLGPLMGMAGIFEGRRSLDINPKAAGPERQEFIEHVEMQPIDPQANGPQLFYGLRYHTRIVKPGEVETFHDQAGVPAAGTSHRQPCRHLLRDPSGRGSVRRHDLRDVPRAGRRAPAVQHALRPVALCAAVPRLSRQHRHLPRPHPHVPRQGRRAQPDRAAGRLLRLPALGEPGGAVPLARATGRSISARSSPS